MTEFFTVIAKDEDWDNCDIKFIGIFDTYELAKKATQTHNQEYGLTIRWGTKFTYKIFSGNVNDCVNIDDEYDLLEKETNRNNLLEYEEKHQKQKEEKENKIKNVSKIFNDSEMCFDYDIENLTTLELGYIIDFFDKYKYLVKNTPGKCTNKFVLETLNNYKVITKLKIENNEYLQNVIEVYNEYGIKFT